jgi:hypothetical protein
MIDYANIRATVVVLKLKCKLSDGEPLPVTLALSQNAKEEQWERLAHSYLLESARRKHYGLKPLAIRDIYRLTAAPAEWDELAGECPGEDDPILGKETQKPLTFFMKGGDPVGLQREGQETAQEITNHPAEGGACLITDGRKQLMEAAAEGGGGRL